MAAGMSHTLIVGDCETEAYIGAQMAKFNENGRENQNKMYIFLYFIIDSYGFRSVISIFTVSLVLFTDLGTNLGETEARLTRLGRPACLERGSESDSVLSQSQSQSLARLTPLCLLVLRLACLPALFGPPCAVGAKEKSGGHKRTTTTGQQRRIFTD